MEYSCMSERILRSLENIINSDSELVDFNIIPTDDNTKNRSPVLFEAHHLGLESWCVKYVYQYVSLELFKVRKSLALRKLSSAKMENLNYLLIGALFINPDVGTFWNMRRDLIENDVLNYEYEFRFSKLVLTRKNKSNEAFAYRRWLLQRILEKTARNKVVPPLVLIENELNLTFMTSTNTPNNYHAWTHRMWCMEKFLHYFPMLLENELRFSEKWISEHVSEHSGYHYRQYVLNSFKKYNEISLSDKYYDVVLQHLNIVSDGESTEVINFLLGQTTKENTNNSTNYIFLLLYELLVVVNNINNYYIEHESLWLHRRFIIFKLMQIANEYSSSQQKINGLTLNSCTNIVNSRLNENGEKLPKLFKSQPVKFENSNLYKILCDTEKSFISSSVNGSQIQANFARKHEKWLKCIVGVDLV